MIRLLELRLEKNLTQRQVAKALFVSQGTYNNWENGKTEPSIEQLIALSDFFGESIDFIVCNNADNGYNAEKRNSNKKEYLQIIENVQTELNLLKDKLSER